MQQFATLVSKVAPASAAVLQLTFMLSKVCDASKSCLSKSNTIRRDLYNSSKITSAEHTCNVCACTVWLQAVSNICVRLLITDCMVALNGHDHLAQHRCFTHVKSSTTLFRGSHSASALLSFHACLQLQGRLLKCMLVNRMCRALPVQHRLVADSNLMTVWLPQCSAIPFVTCIDNALLCMQYRTHSGRQDLTLMPLETNTEVQQQETAQWPAAA